MSKKTGFALLSKKQRQELSAKGGKKAQENGNAFRWDENTGKEAGRKGGKARWNKQS